MTRTCREFWAAKARGLGGRTSLDVADLIAIGARCAEVRAIGEARDARQSAVRTFQLSKASLNVLPATLALAVTAGDSVRLWAAGRRGVTLRGAVPRARATVEHLTPADTLLRVWGRRQQLLLEIVARGDFDGDGWDDLLLHVVAGARGGSFTTDEVFVLTRRSLGAPFTVVRRIW